MILNKNHVLKALRQLKPSYKIHTENSIGFVPIFDYLFIKSMKNEAIMACVVWKNRYTPIEIKLIVLPAVVCDEKITIKARVLRGICQEAINTQLIFKVEKPRKKLIVMDKNCTYTLDYLDPDLFPSFNHSITNVENKP